MATTEASIGAAPVIVEDDYDGEFRYEGQPLESLQGLDTDGRIIYVGTFSRTVFPALRVGYLIVPGSLSAVFTAAKWLNDQHSPTLEQETLAEFISSGAYERHLRRVRRRNAARREALLKAIHEYLGDRVSITGDGAGAHIVLWPKRRVFEDEIVAQAAARGVGVLRHISILPDEARPHRNHARLRPPARARDPRRHPPSWASVLRAVSRSR